jgi:hypothetical protein
LDGNHYKSTTFSTFITSFVVATTTITIEIRSFASYWIAYEKSGNIAFFCNVQTTKTIGSN